ncbi:MAG: molybdenum ABC transporter ATP-binding protein [Marinovum sp.]|nr:molybdenum ABC transporter ATP-binding protein [Marinovum sp.]
MTLFVHVKHRYESLSIDVVFEAPPGLTVLFGPSGCGKTSIMRAVAGLLRSDRAEISLDDHVLSDGRRFLPPHKRGLGYVFQDHRLFPHMSVLQNLRYGQRFAQGGGIELGEERVIELLGLGPLRDRRPVALSGGEAARVALGRALLARPRMLLADEPLASLDAARKAEILPYFERLRDELDVPILYVSHSAAEVARLATTIVALSQGRVVKTGAARDVLADPNITPAGPRAVGAVLDAQVRTHHSDGLTELDAGGIALFLPNVSAPVGAMLRVRIAAQDVILSTDAPGAISALNHIPGQVKSMRAGSGPGTIVALDTAAGALLARITARSAKALDLQEGRAVWAIVKTVSVAPDDVGGGRG